MTSGPQRGLDRGTRPVGLAARAAAVSGAACVEKKSVQPHPALVGMDARPAPEAAPHARLAERNVPHQAAELWQTERHHITTVHPTTKAQLTATLGVHKQSEETTLVDTSRVRTKAQKTANVDWAPVTVVTSRAER